MIEILIFDLGQVPEEFPVVSSFPVVGQLDQLLVGFNCCEYNNIASSCLVACASVSLSSSYLVVGVFVILPCTLHLSLCRNFASTFRADRATAPLSIVSRRNDRAENNTLSKIVASLIRVTNHI